MSLEWGSPISWTSLFAALSVSFGLMLFKQDAGASAAIPSKLPLLPLRDMVVFPGMRTQLFVGRERSMLALAAAIAAPAKLVMLAAQKSAKVQEPSEDDIFEVGTVCEVVEHSKLPDGTVKVVILGQAQARIKKYASTSPHFVVELEPRREAIALTVELTATMRNLVALFEDYAKLQRDVSPEALHSVQMCEDPAVLVDLLGGGITTLKVADRQSLLEIQEVTARLQKADELLRAEVEILQVQKKIRSRVKKQMEKTQKEYYLNEQMSAIQRELGSDKDEFKNELAELEEQMAGKKLSADAEERIKKELRKLKMMHPTSAEATVVRNYIDVVLSLPWGEKSVDDHNLMAAQAVLDEDHFGLTKVKERILEHLAVQVLTNKIKGPVLCLVGPPGVGKTSLARSIAKSMGRKYARIALGGVRDEAEIRGHRRTYIGAMPGKILHQLKKVGTNNPVLLLDEIDKLASDFRGDPSSALLEVLDPEQNHVFNDHYLDLDYDLSDVMFICTANSQSAIPMPLQDRMEIIRLSGYTEPEKMAIVVKYLAPRQREDAGLAEGALMMTDAAIRRVIREYTFEAGVRSLERELGGIARKVARRVVETGDKSPVVVRAADVSDYLGVAKVNLDREKDSVDTIGVTNGLAVVGDVTGALLVCEVAVLPGKGKVVVSGMLGNMMQESGQAAVSYVRSRAERMGIAVDFHEKFDVHVHFPDPSPKDGNSAGVTMATSLASALLKVAVRSDVAMTGEISLTGRVMAIGGLKEKLMAAQRRSIKICFVPFENLKDLHDVPKSVLESMRIVFARHADEVLREALVLDNAAQVFGAPKEVLEMRAGELVMVGPEGVRAYEGAAVELSADDEVAVPAGIPAIVPLADEPNPSGEGSSL